MVTISKSKLFAACTKVMDSARANIRNGKKQQKVLECINTSLWEVCHRNRFWEILEPALEKVGRAGDAEAALSLMQIVDAPLLLKEGTLDEECAQLWMQAVGAGMDRQMFKDVTDAARYYEEHSPQNADLTRALDAVQEGYSSDGAKRTRLRDSLAAEATQYYRDQNDESRVPTDWMIGALEVFLRASKMLNHGSDDEKRRARSDLQALGAERVSDNALMELGQIASRYVQNRGLGIDIRPALDGLGISSLAAWRAWENGDEAPPDMSWDSIRDAVLFLTETDEDEADEDESLGAYIDEMTDTVERILIASRKLAPGSDNRSEGEAQKDMRSLGEELDGDALEDAIRIARAYEEFRGLVGNLDGLKVRDPVMGGNLGGEERAKKGALDYLRAGFADSEYRSQFLIRDESISDPDLKTLNENLLYMRDMDFVDDRGRTETNLLRLFLNRYSDTPLMDLTKHIIAEYEGRADAEKPSSKEVLNWIKNHAMYVGYTGKVFEELMKRSVDTYRDSWYTRTPYELYLEKYNDAPQRTRDMMDANDFGRERERYIWMLRDAYELPDQGEFERAIENILESMEDDVNAIKKLGASANDPTPLKPVGFQNYPWMKNADAFRSDIEELHDAVIDLLSSDPDDPDAELPAIPGWTHFDKWEDLLNPEMAPDGVIEATNQSELKRMKDHALHMSRARKYHPEYEHYDLWNRPNTQLRKSMRILAKKGIIPAPKYDYEADIRVANALSRISNRGLDEKQAEAHTAAFIKYTSNLAMKLVFGDTPEDMKAREQFEWAMKVASSCKAPSDEDPQDKKDQFAAERKKAGNSMRRVNAHLIEMR